MYLKIIHFIIKINHYVTNKDEKSWRNHVTKIELSKIEFGLNIVEDRGK